MKKLLVFASLIVGFESAAFAADPVGSPPSPNVGNHYSCSFATGAFQGWNRVTANTTSLRGTPELYLSRETDRASANVESVQVKQTTFGLEIYGYTQGLADAFETWTLLVPQVLFYNRRAVQVQGMMVRSFTSTMPMPFGPVVTENRLAQHNTYIPVTCLAAFIQP